MARKSIEERLGSPRWSARVEGLVQLAAENRLPELLAFALQESDRAVVAAACDLLFPEPTELLVHLFSLQKGADAPLEFRNRITRGNYLYAESGLHRLFRPRLTRLTIDHVDAFGLAYLRSFGHALPRYVRPTLRTYASALSEGDAAARPRRWIVASDGHDQWDSHSEMTLSAMVSLRRLGGPVDREPLRTLAEAARSIEHAHLSRFAAAVIEWVSFDLGFSDSSVVLEQLILEGAFEVVPDYATTLLKRGDEENLLRFLVDVPQVYRVAAGFAFWPFTDFLEKHALLDSYEYGRYETQPLHPYRRARAMDAAPPPWYQWGHAA